MKVLEKIGKKLAFAPSIYWKKIALEIQYYCNILQYIYIAIIISEPLILGLLAV
jgi:hypothetical protein